MTPQPKSEFLRVLSERGFIHQCTDPVGLEMQMAKGSIGAYIGFDCTAKSLHVGSLIQIMVLRWLQRCGHTPIILLGGFTTRVGDPSGKDEARKALSDVEISANMQGIRGVFQRMGLGGAAMVDNAEWLDKLSYREFLDRYARHFSVNHMLTVDSVKLRLEREQHLSALEFNYMMLQAIDFCHLAETPYHCRLQIGGSDQWGNIVSGIQLHHKMTAATANLNKMPLEAVPYDINKRLFGLTTPLLTTSSGTKMGKTAAGAVWLNADMLSPYDYWQFWRNTEDADVGRFLRLFTELPMEEIARLEKLKDAEINDAKKILANEATRLCHGEAAANEAAETARKTFEEGAAGDALPEIAVSKHELDAGIPAFQLFHRAGLAESGGEAKRLIKGGGGKVNDQTLQSETAAIGAAHLNVGGFIKLTAGKKRHALVKVK